MLQETIPGTRDFAARWAMAEEKGIATLRDIGGLSDADAETAWRVYLHAGLARADPVMGVPEWRHGAFLARDVVRRAVEHSAELLAARANRWRKRR